MLFEVLEVENYVSAQDIKRRGIGAVDTALRQGPVHVIRRNRPTYVILSEEDYQRLIGRRDASNRLWAKILSDEPASNGRKANEINQQVDEERSGWDS